MASTLRPTWSVSESPVGRGFSFSGGASILSTAMSLPGATPTTLASQTDWSFSPTIMLFAPSITWALVMTIPSLDQMKPVPVPRGISNTFIVNRSRRNCLLVMNTVEGEAALKISTLLSSSRDVIFGTTSGCGGGDTSRLVSQPAREASKKPQQMYPSTFFILPFFRFSAHRGTRCGAAPPPRSSGGSERKVIRDGQEYFNRKRNATQRQTPARSYAMVARIVVLECAVWNSEFGGEKNVQVSNRLGEGGESTQDLHDFPIFQSGIP